LDRVDIIVSTSDGSKKKTEIFMKDVLVAFAQGTDDNFAGVAVEVSAEEAPKLIHMQNYADHNRVLKANVGDAATFGEGTDQVLGKDDESLETETKPPESKEEGQVTEEKKDQPEQGKTEDESVQENKSEDSVN